MGEWTVSVTGLEGGAAECPDSPDPSNGVAAADPGACNPGIIPSKVEITGLRDGTQYDDRVCRRRPRSTALPRARASGCAGLCRKDECPTGFFDLQR